MTTDNTDGPTGQDRSADEPTEIMYGGAYQLYETDHGVIIACQPVDDECCWTMDEARRAVRSHAMRVIAEAGAGQDVAALRAELATERDHHERTAAQLATAQKAALDCAKNWKDALDELTTARERIAALEAAIREWVEGFEVADLADPHPDGPRIHNVDHFLFALTGGK